MSRNPSPHDPGNLPQKQEPTALAPVRAHFPPPRVEEHDRISLHEILSILSQRRWEIAAVALAILVIATIQVFTTTPLYQATATLQIDPEQPKLELYEQVSSFSSRDSEEYLFTQARNLQTRALARRVVDRLGLTGNPDFTEPLNRGFFGDRLRDAAKLVRRVFYGPPGQGGGVDRFLAGLSVQLEHNTRLVHVNFSARDPELAASIANATVDEFISQSFETRFEATQRASSFLEERLEELRLKVEESEARALRYARENDIVNLNETDTVNRQRLIDLNSELTRVESDLIEKTAQYRLVQGATVESLPERLQNSQTQALSVRIAQVEGELANLTASYGDSWPEVVRLRTELDELRAQLRAQNAEAIANATRDYQAALDHRNRLVAAVAQQRVLVEDLDESAIQHNLQRGEVEANKQLYEGLLERLKETGVNSGLKASNIRLVDSATAAGKPSSPKKVRALLLALLVGLVFGMGVAFLLEALDRTVKTPDDVGHHLHVPTMAVIPRMNGDHRPFFSVLRRSRSERTDPYYIFGDNGPPPDGMAEAYRSLRTSIMLSNTDKPIQTIMVTSPLPSEGKTTTASNIAAILAQTGHQTLIMDLDLRRSKVADVFEVPGDQGMSTFLSSNSSLNALISKTEDPRLFVLPAGPRAPNPAELVSSQRMLMGLKLLSEHFTYVVIDTPPASGASDALALSRHVDGVLVVVRSGQTPIRATKMLTTSLLAAGARVLGVVLNDAPLSRDLDYYPGGYYYSHYYAHDEGA